VKSEIKRRRIIVVAAIAISGAVFAFLAIGGIGKNLVYYWSPTELLASGEKALGANVRLGGLVEVGSLEKMGDGLTLKFAVTDGTQSVPVEASTVPPAMFREGIGVVVEGTLKDDGVFQTHRLMVKHDNQYQAPSEGEDVDVEDLMKSMQFEVPST
jgi:cytochrome c-type biogenesis protein CcmE